MRQTCRRNVTYVPLSITNVTMLSRATEEQLMLQLANYGPQIVSVFSTDNLKNYGSGVLSDDKCFTGNCDKINHAVVAVGYGTDSVLGDYWLIRNTWGKSWVSFILYSQNH